MWLRPGIQCPVLGLGACGPGMPKPPPTPHKAHVCGSLSSCFRYQGLLVCTSCLGRSASALPITGPLLPPQWHVRTPEPLALAVPMYLFVALAVHQEDDQEQLEIGLHFWQQWGRRGFARARSELQVSFCVHGLGEGRAGAGDQVTQRTQNHGFSFGLALGFDVLELCQALGIQKIKTISFQRSQGGWQEVNTVQG